MAKTTKPKKPYSDYREPTDKNVRDKSCKEGELWSRIICTRKSDGVQFLWADDDTQASWFGAHRALKIKDQLEHKLGDEFDIEVVSPMLLPSHA